MVQGNATFLHFPKETASQPNQNIKIKLVFGKSLVHEICIHWKCCMQRS